MLRSLILLAFSVTSIYYAHIYTRMKLHISSPDTLVYFNAVQLMNNALAEATDLDQHHFQPCRECGYELALVKDVGYCRMSDTYKLLHPKVVLQDLVVFRDYGGQDLARKIMRETMFDGNPRFEQFRQFDSRNESIYHHLPLSSSVLYPYAKNYFRTHTPGYASGCLFQKYYHVPGQEELCLKSNQSTHFRNYIRDLERKKKSPQCIDDAKYMKKTYRLWDKYECEEIFHLMATPAYVNHLRKKGIQHIFKTNMHLGNGILLLDFNNERTIRKWYENGTRCGLNMTKNIIQEYVLNPYLYNKHKMEFRSYFVIASMNPPTIYGYNVALIKQCAVEFSLRDFTKQGHVCNTAITKTHKHVTGNQNEEELYIDWNLQELQDLLLSQGRINSTTWLQDFLLPQIYRKVTHLFLSVKDMLLQDSRVGEFFGVDFIMDDDLRLWIFEANRNPNFLAVTQGRKDKFYTLIQDMIEIEWQYIKSKYKRIREFVLRNLHHFQKDSSPGQRNKLKKEFLDLQADRLEPEFQPTHNRLELIFRGDKSLGVNQSKYLNHECLLD